MRYSRGFRRFVLFVALCAIVSTNRAVAGEGGVSPGTPPQVTASPSGAPDPCVKVEAGATVRPAEQNLDLRFIPVVPETQQRFDSRDWEMQEPQPHKQGGSTHVVPESSPSGTSAPMPGPLLTFPGLGFSDACTGGQCGGGWPPDTNGDVGPNHYIQAVNTAFGIYNKSGTLLASTTFNSLWSGAGTGTPCDNKNDGDPVVIYDPMGDRWFVTDFAFAISGGKPVAPCYECIAVSKTPDPVSGGWYLYAINQSSPPGGSNLMNDYPKFGIWPDGLYQSSNMFNLPATTFWGTAFWAYPRLPMESGAAITPIAASISGSSTFTLLPANLRIGPQGAFPPAGTAEYLLGDSQSAYAFEVRKFSVNWGTSTGTISGGTNVAYSSSATNPRSPAQSGSAIALDSLSWRGMVQAQYKKVGSAESLWLNHTVASSASVNDGPQWSQINVTGGTIATTPVQTQIYQPDTTLDRWMASLAVDGLGDMAIGYSTSNASSFPSLNYSGRLVGDTLNTLPQTENTLYAGAGSQSGTCGGSNCTRWGDYSGMSVDPTDDCTFWYTNEYYAATGLVWKTRIGAFKFPSCTLTSGTLVVTVTDCSGAAVKNAVVNIDSHDYGVTPATGIFNAYLAPGSHSVYATYSGNTSTTKTASITAGVTTNLTLAVGPLPSAPAAPTFTSVGQTSLTVNWAAVSGATSYDVWRKAGSSCSGAAKITASPVAGTSYGDSGLTCNTQYSYYVVANNGCGASAAGSCASQTTSACSTPPLRVPYSVNPTKFTTTTHGASGTVTWDTSNCASTNYHIIYGKGENLAAWTVDGGKCSLGTSGNYGWTSIPDPSSYTSRFLWFLVVGDNGGTTEGSWGLTSGGAERGGTNASSQCSCASKNTTGSCGTS
jgi:hypothetical protein